MQFIEINATGVASRLSKLSRAQKNVAKKAAFAAAKEVRKVLINDVLAGGVVRPITGKLRSGWKVREAQGPKPGATLSTNTKYASAIHYGSHRQVLVPAHIRSGTFVRSHFRMMNITATNFLTIALRKSRKKAIKAAFKIWRRRFGD